MPGCLLQIASFHIVSIMTSCLKMQDFFIDIHFLISVSVELGLIFSHTEKYPDEPPLLNVKRCTSVFSSFVLSIIVIVD